MEADSVDLQNEWTSTGAEVTARVNFDLLRGWTLEARACRDQSSIGSESVRRRRHERATPTVQGEGGEERKNTRSRSVKR